MPLDLPRRSNSSLRGRPPHDAAKPDSEAFNDAVQQVKSTGSVSAAARKLALYAKMTGGSVPAAAAAGGSDGEKEKEKARAKANETGESEVRDERKEVGGDGDVGMASPSQSVEAGQGDSVKAESSPAGSVGRSSNGSADANANANANAAARAKLQAKASAFDDPEEQEYNARNAYIAAQAKRTNALNGAHAGGNGGGQGGNGYIAEDDEYALEDEDMDDDAEARQLEVEDEPVVHLQEIVEGLWVGDLVAAMDTEGLKERGISNILSLLRPKIQFSSDFAVFPLEIDDSPDTDILTHLPTCVAWVGEALRRRERVRERLRRSSSQSMRRRTSTSSNKSSSASRSPTSPLAESASGGGHVRENSPPEERDVLIRHLPQTTAGAVLVHCQAGMSRSATAAAAYLMTALGLAPDEAVDVIRSKRPVVDPSETFWHQLGLFHSADGRVSLRDRGTRQFYMERTTTRFMNRGGQPDISHMAKYPATPTASSPPTPSGSHGKRKIRCKMCRRHLAVREHMMDHILDQSPASRPRTPSIGAMSAAMTPILPQDGSNSVTGSGARERRASVVSDIINPLTGLPGARSRHASMSSDRPVLGDLTIPNSSSNQPANTVSTATPTASSQGSVPTPRSRSIDVTASGFGITAMTASDATRSQSSQGFGPGRKVTAGPYADDDDEGDGGMVVDTPATMSRSTSLDHRPQSASSHSGSAGMRRKSSLSQMSNADGIGTRHCRSAEQIYANLPPQLAALRMAQNGGQSSVSSDTAVSTPDAGSPPSSPERESHSTANVSGGKPFPAMPPQGQGQAQYPPNHPLAHLQTSQSAHAPYVPGHSHAHKNEGARGAARRMSMLALTPTEGTSPGADRMGLHGHGHGHPGSGTNSPRERRGSGVFGFGGEIATGGPPILVNPKCSGYFVEPLTWMEPVLASGQISGKLVCPNEKCGAKIGNYDWAGVQCGCREWVTPGFCISRSKVDEVW